MPLSPSPDSAPEHSRRDQIRRYLHKFTTTIRRGSKDATDDNIPQFHAPTHEHSHDETLFDFSNIIVAEEAPSTCQLREDPQPEPQRMNGSETFLVDRESIYQERCQRMRDRYGFNVDGKSQAQIPLASRRVQRPVRMRVHRSCHMCGVDYGHGIHCRACHHRMCSDCPRAPGKRIQEAMSEARHHPFETHSGSEWDGPSKHVPHPLGSLSLEQNRSEIKSLTTPLTSQDFDEKVLPTIEADDASESPDALITDMRKYRKDACYPNTLLAVNDPILRAPAGVQRVYRKTRQRVRYTCHQCKSPFGKGRTCSHCNHERCQECRERGHSKGKAKPDPKLIEAVNRRLAEIGQ